MPSIISNVNRREVTNNFSAFGSNRTLNVRIIENSYRYLLVRIDVILAMNLIHEQKPSP